MTTRSLIVSLLLLFGILQYKLWVSSNGVAQTINLNRAISAQQQANERLSQRNQRLLGQINELQRGKASVVDLARNELGMVRPHETYYQFVS